MSGFPSTPGRAPRGLSRRAFLGGSGTLIALPFLESLLPRGLRAAPPPPKRLLFYFVPCGIHMPAWTPKEVGAGYQLPPILQPLAAVKDSVLVISGLGNKPGIPDGTGDHAGGTSAFLTCAHARKSDVDISLGISVDQVAAQVLGRGVRYPSLQLGLEVGTSAGTCDSGYGCAYMRNISWAGPKTPLPKTIDPQLVFDVLFSGEDLSQTAEQIARRKRYRKSVLDYALDEGKRLSGRLGQNDRHKLDEYLSGVRDVEQRLAAPLLGCGGAMRPESDLAFKDQVRIMSDLMVLAMQCDLTRIISFMLNNGQSIRSYAFIGVGAAHHEISHHMNDPAKQSMLQTINTWEVEQLAYLLTRMSAIKEGEGTLLDNSLIYFSSEVADGNSHTHTDLPVLVAGKLGGTIKSGRHMMQTDVPVANLFTSILQAVGVNASRFGDDGTGPLSGLT